ncbi:MAG: ABC transporter substrate-binding protein [Acidimicrobiales bacterium]|nr:ABC transporter substrate-binding protein [Acidimicrobiales bacterium]
MTMRILAKLAAAVTAVALLAGACGSDDPVVGTGDCDTVDSASLQLQWVTQAQFAGYYAAVDQGIYDKYCLDVTILEGGVDIVPQQQLASGAVDFAVSWVPKALVSREEGADIVNVAQVFQRSGTLQVSWADSGINGPADLAGKVVGNWGWGNEFELLAGAHQAGLDPSSDFELVGQSFDMLALLTGEIDAAQAMIYNEYAQVLEAVNPDTGSLYTEDDLSVINWNDEGTAMLQDAIWADGARLANEDYQDLTTRFVAGSLEGWAYCRDNGGKCVDIVLDNGSALGASHQAWQMNEINGLIWPSSDGVGMMDADLWAQTVDVATSQPILSAAPDAGAYTTEYAEAALKILNGRGMDTTGKNWQRVSVTLNPGGE